MNYSVSTVKLIEKYGEKIDLAYPEHMQSSAYVFVTVVSKKKKKFLFIKVKKRLM